MDREVLWHPRIHELFGEELAFFGISASSSAPLRDEVETSLNEFLPYYSAYTVYGLQDIIIRVYGSQARFQSLSLWLERSLRFGGGTVSAFRCEQIHYLWGHKITGEDIDLNAIGHDFEELRRAQADWQNYPKRDALIEAGIALGSIDPMATGPIRAFIFIDTPDVSGLQVINGILKQFREIKYPKENVIGLFRGVGMSNILLELRTAEYGDIWRFNLELQKILGLSRARTTTFLVSDVIAEHYDRCNFDEPSLFLENVWGEQFPELKQMRPLAKFPIIRACETLKQWMGKPGSFVQGYIQSMIDSNAEQGTSEVLKLASDFEKRLEKIVKRTAPTVFDRSNWPEAMGRIAVQLANKKVGQWTLGNWVEGFIVLHERGAFEDIEKDDLRVLRDFKEFRNICAHRVPGYGSMLWKEEQQELLANFLEKFYHSDLFFSK